MKYYTVILITLIQTVAIAQDLPPKTPVVKGDWWTIAGNPDLGAYTTPEQQPVDFGIWQAADGSWQLWSCIRHTKAGENTRLFYRWEGQNLTDQNWKPMGIAMEADTTYGEQSGGLQAPYVVRRMTLITCFTAGGTRFVWPPARMAKTSSG